MADLDDFFAKKDRKKSKGKKFATPDELVKKLEDTTKRNEVKPPRKEPQSTQSDGVENESGEPQVTAVEEDEWRDFEEEERNVDLTGLKIQNVQLNDDDYFSGSDADGGDEDGEDGDSEKGAWKKMSAGVAAAANAAGTDAKANSQAESDKKKQSSGLSATSTGRYISPALRQQSLLPVRLKKDALPDINNEEYFPTLGDAKKEEIRKKKNEPAFEEVKQGARFQRSSDLPTNAPVSIGNRYNSLADS